MLVILCWLYNRVKRWERIFKKVKLYSLYKVYKKFYDLLWVYKY